MGLFTVTAKITQLWSTKLDAKFNTLAIGSVFREPGAMLVSGGEDGSVRLYNLPTNHRDTESLPTLLECKSCLESKGGHIQALAIHDVTRFFTNDLIVGDSRGTLTVFSNGQIVSRQTVSDQIIRCLVVEHDDTGNMAMIATDSNGSIIASLPNVQLWKVRLSDFPPIKGLRASIKTLVAVTFTNTSGSCTNYILATDDQRHLFVLQRGTIVMMLNTPSVINAMCVGRFVSDPDTLGGALSIDVDSTDNAHQVALGGENGGIYILQNFRIYKEEYANAQLPISHLATLPASHTDMVDAILCAGHFNALTIFHNSKMIHRQQTPDWVISVLVPDVDQCGAKEVVVGCFDNSVVCYKLNVS